MFSLLVTISILFFLGADIFKGNTKSILISLGALSYSFLVAMKGGSGSDTHVYEFIFENKLTYAESFVKEPGYHLVYMMVDFLGGDFSYINYFQAIIVSISLFMLAKYRSGFLVVIYITLCGLTFDFSTMRQSFSFHIFSLCFLLTGSYFYALPSALLFHFGSILSLVGKIDKINVKSLIAVGVAGSLFNYLFLSRYIEHGSQFLFRDGYSWMLLVIAYCFVFYSYGYKNIRLLIILLMMIVPIGYRVVAYLLVQWEVGRLSLEKKKIVFPIVLIIAVLKVISFQEQSIINDKDRSVILYFQQFKY